jgi:hypothetical protein
MDLEFPGFDEFEPTAPLLHAIFTLKDKIPDGCESIRVEFDQQGAAFVTAATPDGGFSNVDLEEDELGAAGFLLNYISHQVIQLTNMVKKQGDEEVKTAQQKLAASLGQSSLSIGLLEEPVGEGEDMDFADSLTIFRQPR